jgi:hypothetical protein
MFSFLTCIREERCIDNSDLFSTLIVDGNYWMAAIAVSEVAVYISL